MKEIIYYGESTPFTEEHQKYLLRWVMPMAEICAECYPKYFPAYPEMEIEVGSEFCKCIGCGEMKEIVKRVIVAGKVVDVN